MNQAMAGSVTPPRAEGFVGADVRFAAAEAEVAGLLAAEPLSPGQWDRVAQLDDWIAFMPAASLEGAAVKLRRLLCGRAGTMVTEGQLRLNGADIAALRDVLRLVETANRAPVHAFKQEKRA